MHHQSGLSLALVLAFAACAAPAKAPPPPVDVTALKDSIQAREHEWSAGFLAGNAAGIAALYTTDAASIPPTGDWARGRDAITKMEQLQLDTIAATAREDITDEVIPAGEYVVEIGHYSYTGTNKMDKKPRSSSGRYMEIWKKDTDGVWRILRDIGNEAPAPATKKP